MTATRLGIVLVGLVLVLLVLVEAASPKKAPPSLMAPTGEQVVPSGAATQPAPPPQPASATRQ